MNDAGGMRTLNGDPAGFGEVGVEGCDPRATPVPKNNAGVSLNVQGFKLETGICFLQLVAQGLW